jgi:hypothetical protein
VPKLGPPLDSSGSGEHSDKEPNKNESASDNTLLSIPKPTTFETQGGSMHSTGTVETEQLSLGGDPLVAVRSPVRDIIHSFNRASDHNRKINKTALVGLPPLPIHSGSDHHNDWSSNHKMPLPKKLKIKWPPVVGKPVVREKEIGKLSLLKSVEGSSSVQKGDPVRNSSIRLRWAGPTYFNIKNGRPLYVDEFFYGKDGDELPFVPLIENRFDGTSGVSDDACPKIPKRSRSNLTAHGDDEWTDSENNVRNKYRRPDVWVTPTNEAVQPKRKRWKVKRVWYIDEIDREEKEHEANGGRELMEKVKELLGVPTGPSSCAESEYDPTSHYWKINKVLDVEGVVYEESRSQKMDEADVMQHMVEMEIEHEEVVGRWTYHVRDEGQEEEDPDWDVPEFVEDDGEEEIPPPDDKDDEEKEASGPEADVVEELNMEPPQAPSSKPPKSPKKTKKKKKKKREDDYDDCIFNLLSPPPVTIMKMK